MLFGDSGYGLYEWKVDRAWLQGALKNEGAQRPLRKCSKLKRLRRELDLRTARTKVENDHLRIEGDRLDHGIAELKGRRLDGVAMQRDLSLLSADELYLRTVEMVSSLPTEPPIIVGDVKASGEIEKRRDRRLVVGVFAFAFGIAGLALFRKSSSPDLLAQAS